MIESNKIESKMIASAKRTLVGACAVVLGLAAPLGPRTQTVRFPL